MNVVDVFRELRGAIDALGEPDSAWRETIPACLTDSTPTTSTLPGICAGLAM